MSTEHQADLDVVIVGAGLAGLSCAKHLQRAGKKVAIYEASDGVGGRVRTDELDGYLLDRGFQVLLTAYPEIKTEVDLAALDMKYFSPGALVRVGNKNHVVGDPLREPSTLFSTTFAPIGNVFDKARIAALRLKLGRGPARRLLQGEDMSTADALREQGFSQRMVSTFFTPLVGGIQLDPDLSTSRRMFDIIFRTLSNGNTGVPARGMGELSNYLATQLLNGTVHLHSPVSEVTSTSVTLNSGEKINARCVVVATEGPAASALLNLPPVASRSVSCVYFSADTAPTKEKLIALDSSHSGPVLNMAVMSNISSHYAPQGKHLIAAACPGVTTESEPQLVSKVTQQLLQWWGPQVNTWQHLRTYSIVHGQPDQSPPFAPKKPVALANEVFVCGDHRDTGSSQGAMYSGRRCAVSVLKYLA
jgi:phytoene dehydrogenase-like protein